MSGMPPNDALNSWKEIAGYLGVRVRTAQKWEEKRQLPVRRLPGRKGRVSAVPEDLDQWRSRVLGSATRTRRPRLRAIYAIAPMVALVGVASWLALLRLRSVASEPVSIRTEFNTLRVFDDSGREIWHRTFDEPFAYNAYGGEPGQRRVWLGDIDGDGHTEILFAYFPASFEQTGCRLYCFSRTGAVNWTFTARSIADRTQTYAPTYVISGFEVLDFGDGHGRQIAMTSRHAIWHPNQFAILDGHGKLRGEYWHSGHLDYMAFADLDGDGVREILLTGVNNGERAATLVVLDPRTCTGASRQAPDSPYQILGVPTGREKAVLSFPRTCISRKYDLYNMGKGIYVDGDFIRVRVLERMNSLDQVILYTLDRQLMVRAAEPSDAFRAAHLALERSGGLDHSLSPKEIAALQASVRTVRP